MASTTNGQAVIVRTDRGLTIAGTRCTLYAVMDYLNAGWTGPLIQDWLGLNDSQIAAALGYIDAHRQALDAEYQTVQRQSDETRKYWESQRRERQPTAATAPEQHSELRGRLAEWKAELEQT